MPADRPKVKRKYTSFSAEQRALIGCYAAEHSNSAAAKKFKSNFEQGLGESTIQEEIPRGAKESQGDSPSGRGSSGEENCCQDSWSSSFGGRV